MSSKRYTVEFRSEAVRQVTERGYPVREVAGRLGVSTHSLYKWLKEAGKNPAPGGAGRSPCGERPPEGGAQAR